MIPIKATDNEKALQFATKLLPESALEDLTKVAELCCCSRYHRNKVWGSHLAQDLAHRRYNEKQTDGVFPAQPRSSTAKAESDQTIAITFAKHQIDERESLVSILLSSVPQPRKTGSVYIYTHAAEAFQGMIKIGFTCKTVGYRLEYWAECGHGNPILVESVHNLSHPSRLDQLIHLELVEYWHALRWRETHQRSHIEWFKVNSDRGKTLAHHWSQWMRSANPYDGLGQLKELWKAHIEFLVQHENPITAEALCQIQRIKDRSAEVNDFIDDEELRKQRDHRVKEDRPPVEKKRSWVKKEDEEYQK
jgi:hypothetical protein